MECIGVQNVAAMAVCTYPSLSCTRRKSSRSGQPYPLHKHYGSHVVMSFRVSCSATSPSVVVKEEDFADEEDCIKAGGSELLFVQMQQNKQMDKQSRLSDKLPTIPIGDTILDLVVIGCGPAGLALAAESAKLGLNVGLVGPDLPFTNNYGVWEDEFKELGLEGCIEHVWRDTVVYLDEGDPIFIGRAYGRVSRHLLHEELLKRYQNSHMIWLDLIQ
ncbi:hypothetical protein LIER_42076 [Lithospermum erythrorhizon]|uniref:Lycopene epsilon-cyclase n=1 Tax=Lithospermum erythrorhizon TaxID=34254 RepID=A0AAV3RN62_LITER